MAKARGDGDSKSEAGFETYTFAGKQAYMCSDCQFDTLDKASIQEHVDRNLHIGTVIRVQGGGPPTPPADGFARTHTYTADQLTPGEPLPAEG